MASAPVTSPQGIGEHIANATQSARSTSSANAASSVIGENAAGFGAAAVQKQIEERIDEKK